MKSQMFLLAGVFFAASCIVSLQSSLLAEETYEFDLQQGSALSFENTNGDLEVTEWESDYVQIETHIYGDSIRGIPSDLEIKFEEMESELSAIVEYPSGFSNISVDFAVKVPHDMDYIICHSTTNGDTSIIGDFIAEVDAVNGDIYLEVMSSNGLKTINGDISAVFSDQMTSLIVESVNGDISLEISDLLDLVAETVNGEIEVDGIQFEDQMSITGDGTAIVEIETVNGSIEITHFSFLGKAI